MMVNPFVAAKMRGSASLEFGLRQDKDLRWRLLKVRNEVGPCLQEIHLNLQRLHQQIFEDL